MAFDFSKLNFFSKLDARARVAVLLGGLVGLIFFIYLAVNYFSPEAATVGPSRVAKAPSDIRSVPGAETSAEYQRALLEANQQAAQQAQMSGSSAVPTMVNFGGGQPAGNCVICSDKSADVKNLLDEWARQGKLTPEVSTALQKLADKNVTVDEYASQLDDLVKQGKLSPDQARSLLAEYKKQHTNQRISESESAIDKMIQAGKVPLEVANTLLAMQEKGVSTTEYAAALQKLVKDGKLTPDAAQQLLAQYTQSMAKEVIQKSIASIRQLAKEGKVIPEVETALIDLEMKTVPLKQYNDTLQGFLDKGKITPAVAKTILDEYQWQKAAIGPTGSIDDLLAEAEAAAYAEIAELVAGAKISAEVGDALREMIKSNIPFDDFVKTVNQMVQAGKITVDISKLKIADYRRVKGLRDMSVELRNLQANNASASQYADALKKYVKFGSLTPEEASRLMQEYNAVTSQPIASAGTATTSAFAALQERVAQAQEGEQQVATTDEFAVPQEQERLSQQISVDQQAQIESMMGAMQGQAGQLVNAWQPPMMQSKTGSYHKETKTTAAEKTADSKASTQKGGATGTALSSALPAVIKAGDILFAVLDTEVNSDYPDSPVMATIVEGKYKGAKLLGKLAVTKGISGQLDRISLNFTLMNMDAWQTGKSVTAYAIDPDTARTVLASKVDYHYLQRFGAIMATSFVQGYANAIGSSSSTTTTGIFGTSTTHPELSPSQKLATAIGQIGQALGSVTQNYVNIPPTVKVDSGVGLGILFMSDVT